MAEDLVNGWSCDQRHRGDGCRDPHGCHCREITAQAASLAGKDKEIERLREAAKGSLVVVQTAIAGRKHAERERDALAAQYAEISEIVGRRGIEAHSLSDDVRAIQRALAKAVEVLRRCEDALSRCYNFTDWPADGSTDQDAALTDVRAFVAQHDSDSAEGK